MDTVEALRHYNRWRRGLEGENPDDAPDPRVIGRHIDAACDEIERLRDVEKAAQWFVDNPDSPLSALEHMRAALDA